MTPPKQAAPSNGSPGWPDGSQKLGSKLLLGLVALLLLSAGVLQLPGRLLFDPDEGRNAEVMREMAVAGEYVVPRLNALPFLDKPFLYYAAGGLSIRLFGAHETAVRLPGLLCTLATLLLVGGFAARRLGAPAGQVAALMLATSPLVLVYSQIVIFDAMLTLWITAAVLAFHRAVETEPGSTRVPWSHLGWAAIALGVLTKGPVAILVPLAAVAPWAVWRRRFARLWSRGAPLVLVLVVAPWVWLVLTEDPRFLHYVVFTETISRLASDELNRNAPIWTYLPILAAGALPWSLVPIAGWRDLRDAWRRREPTVLFLLSWLVTPTVLFSLMHSKRPHYVLPVLPALALLSLWIWSRRRRGETLPGAGAGAMAWIAAGLAMLALGSGAAPGVLRSFDRFGAGTVARTLIGFGIAWIIAGGLAWAGRRSPRLALLAFALPSVAVFALGGPLVARVGEERSARALATAIEAAAPADVELVEIETSPLSLPFYLGRTVTLASRDGAPLRSNYLLRRYDGLVDREPTLRSPAWLADALADCETRRLFVIERRRHATREMIEGHGRAVIAETSDHLLFGGCAATDGLPSAMPGAPTEPEPGAD